MSKETLSVECDHENGSRFNAFFFYELRIINLVEDKCQIWWNKSRIPEVLAWVHALLADFLE